jgi:hypothetical protein
VSPFNEVLYVQWSSLYSGDDDDAVTEDEDSDTATLQTSAATAALATRTMLLPEFENAEVTRLFGVRWHRTHFQIRTQYSRTFHLPIDWNNSDFDWAC